MRHNLPPPRLDQEGWAPVDVTKGTHRKHMLLSKPPHHEATPYIPVLPEVQLAGLIGGLAPNECKALDMIVETADLLAVGRRRWLLVPAPARLLDFLATLGAEFAEREWALEDEEETDVCGFDKEGDPLDQCELEHDGREPDHDNEPDYRTGARTPEDLQALQTRPREPLPLLKPTRVVMPDGSVWVSRPARTS